MSAGPYSLTPTLTDLNGPRGNPYIDPFGPGFFQNPGTFAEGCCGGHDVIDQHDMPRRFHATMPVKSALQVFAALFAAQS